jgi:O-antigen/teichoic acid export membrane protein
MAQVTGKVGGFVAVVVVARALGDVDFGRYTVALALVSILGVAVDFGTAGFLVREGAQRPHALGRLLGQVLALRLAFGLAAVAGAVAMGPVLGFDGPTLMAVVLFALALVLRMLGAAMLSALQALERLGDVAAVQALMAVVQAAAVAGTAAMGGGLIGVSVAILAASALQPAVSWARLRRRWPGRLEVGRRPLRSIAGRAWPFAASSVLVTALTYLDAVMLHAVRGNAETGRYGAAYRILLALAVVPSIYVEALARSVSHMAAHDRPRLAAAFPRMVGHLLTAALPLAAGGALLAGPILRFVYGPAYAGAETALVLLAASVVFAFPGWAFVQAANSLGLERRVAASLVIVVAGNAVANLFLIPAFGLDGAAAATLGAEALFLALVGMELRRAGLPLGARRAVKPLAATAVVAAVVLLLRSQPLVLAVAAGAVTYVLALLAFRTVDPEDRDLLRGVLGLRSNVSPRRGPTAVPPPGEEPAG